MSEPQEKILSPYEVVLRADCKVVAAIASNFQKEHAEILADIMKKHGKGLHLRSPLMRLADAIRLSHAQNEPPG